MVIPVMKEELKCVSTMLGGQYVIVVGTIQMQMLFVDSLDIYDLVRVHDIQLAIHLVHVYSIHLYSVHYYVSVY